MEMDLHVASAGGAPASPCPRAKIGDEQSFAKNSSAVRTPPGAPTTATLEYHDEFAYTTVDERHVRAQSLDTRSVMFTRRTPSAGLLNSSRSPLRTKDASQLGPGRRA